MEKDDIRVDEEITVAKKVTKLREPKTKKKFIRAKGTFSKDITADFSAKQVKNSTKKTVKRLKELLEDKTKNKKAEILWGSVAGIRPYDNKKNAFYIVCNFDDIEVIIPEEWYFPKDYKFGLNYLNLDEEAKCNWRKKSVIEAFGAKICFCLTGVYEHKLDSEFDKSTVVWCMANRLMAMEALQDMYFFHKNRVNEDKEPIKIEKGTPVESFVMGVREDLVFVSVLGCVDVRLDAYLMCNEYLDNCRDKYKAGDIVTMYVQDVQTDEDGKLKIKVTGRNDDVNKQISLMTVGTIYMGHVTKYSPKSENYTITLTNGVRAIVPAQRVQNNLKLAYGDKVSVVIYQIYPNYVSGNAMKI